MRTGRPTLPALLVVAACHANSAGVPVPPGPTRAPAVHVQGNELVDSAGRPVRLRGVNRSGAEYACAQGWGIFDGPSDSPSVSAIASWRTNVVRLPLNETCWLGINGVTPAYAGANYQQAIADYVARLNRAGLVVIVDLHWTCRGMSFQAAGMLELVDAVRGTGATNVIMLGGVQYAATLSQWLANQPADALHNLAASWHVYNFSWCHTSSCWDGQAAPVAQRVPLVLGELGQNDRGRMFVDSLMDWMDARSGSYLAWTWDVWNSVWDLITSYDGTPTPYGATFQARFAS